MSGMERRAAKGGGPKLAEVAARIAAHLKRFEADPAINAYRAMTWPFREPSARVRGTRIEVRRHYAVDGDLLKKTVALAYLAWLDAGGIGNVSEWARAPKGAAGP